MSEIFDSTSSSPTSSPTSSTIPDRWLIESNDRLIALLLEGATLLEEENIENEAESSQAPKRRRKSKTRDRIATQLRLENDYFNENSIYDEEDFERRFRMSKRLFLRIVGDLERCSDFFTQKSDARGRIGFSPVQKCTSAIRQLAYGTAPDMFDEYLNMSERTSRECLHKFSKKVIELYGKEYLRRPTFTDVQRLYEKHASKHGFPGMLGSVDCTHWEWRNCPVAWRGQYMRGDHQRPTIMLEAVASQDLWIWHAFFGVAGSNNDINVLNQSPIFDDVINGKAPECPFEVNGVTYKHGYYLADGIYPEFATFVKAFTHPHDEKRLKFKQAQEAARKDIERAFGVLKQKWHVIQYPARQWSVRKIRNIMYACIILHNMIIQDKGRAISDLVPDELPLDSDQRNFAEANDITLLEIRSRETHNNLRSDLVEHIARIDIPRNDE